MLVEKVDATGHGDVTVEMLPRLSIRLDPSLAQ